MLRFKAVQLYNWGYSPYQDALPIGDVTLVRGRNGSGKTTYLSAISLLLGVRHLPKKHTYDKFVYPGQKIAFIRGVADNAPDVNGRRPFDQVFATFEDSVTLACLLEYTNRWERTYFIVPGENFIPKPDQNVDKAYLFTQDNYRKALSYVGVRDPLLNLLEMGLNGLPDTLRDPVRRFRFFFQLVGDENIQIRYNEARDNWWKQREQTASLETKHNTENAKLEEWEQIIRITRRRRELQATIGRNRLFSNHAQVRDLEREIQTKENDRYLLQSEQKRLDQQRLISQREIENFERLYQEWEAAYREWQRNRDQLEMRRDHARNEDQRQEHIVQNQRVKVNYLSALPDVPFAEAQAHLDMVKAQHRSASGDLQNVQSRIRSLEKDLEQLNANRILYPGEVTNFTTELNLQGIPFLLVADAVEVTDRTWLEAVEGTLGSERFSVVVDKEMDQIRAKKIAERMKYRYYVSGPNTQTSGAEAPSSLWDVVKISDPRIKGWVYQHLTPVSRVQNIEEGHQLAKSGIMSITVDAYKQERRGGRSVFPHTMVCGRNAREAQLKSNKESLVIARQQETKFQQDYDEVDAKLSEANTAIRLVRERLELVKECEILMQEEATSQTLHQAFLETDRSYQEIKNREDGWNDQRSDHAIQKTRLSDQVSRLTQDFDKNTQTQEDILKTIRRCETQLKSVKYDLPDLDDENRRVFEGESINSEQYLRRAQQAEEDLGQLPEARYEINEELYQRQLADVQRLEKEVNEMRQREQEYRELFSRALEDFRRYIHELFGQGMSKQFRNLCRMAGAKGDIQIINDGQDNWLMNVTIGFNDKPVAKLEEAHLSQGQEVMSGLYLVLSALQTVNATPILLLDELMSTLDDVNAPLVLNNLKVANAQCFVATPHVRPQADAIADVIWGLQPKMDGEAYAPPVGVLVRRKN